MLTDYQAELVEHLVSSSRDQNASEVLREGLRLVEHQEEESKVCLKALREAVRVGIADIETGRLGTFGSARDLRWCLDELRDSALAPRSSNEPSKQP